MHGPHMTTHAETSPHASPAAYHEARNTFSASEAPPLSLETMIREFYPYVQRLALTILDDGSTSMQETEAEADDAAQDTFLAASRALPNFRGDASLKTWLTTITVNQCRNRLRKRKTRHRLQTLITKFQS